MICPPADSDKPDAPHDELAARANRWHIAYDPRVLWPHVEPQVLQPAADEVAAAVAARLRDEPASLGAPNGSDAAAIGVAAHLSGTGPLLGFWLERDELRVHPALASLLTRQRTHARARAERIARGAIPMLARLVEGGIAPVVMKGFHTAHVYFPEPGLRPMADVDIVVAPSDIARAESLLREAGFQPSPTIVQPYKRDWYPPDHDNRLWSFEVFHAREGWKLELHDRANFGYLRVFGLRLDGGVRHGAGWQVGGVPVRVPAQPLLTVLLAVHQSVELRVARLLRLVELIHVIRRDLGNGSLEWEEFDALLDEFGARRFVYPALSFVEQLVPGTVDPAVLSRSRRTTTRLARVMVSGMTPSRPILDRRAGLVERLMWVGDIRDLGKRAKHFLNPIPGAPVSEVVKLYAGRARRLVLLLASQSRALGAGIARLPSGQPAPTRDRGRE